MTATREDRPSAIGTPLWERVEGWHVWSSEPMAVPAAVWVETVERLAAGGGSLHRSKHADTYRWARSRGDVYVKIYRRYRRWTAIKDWFRPSKAENVRRVSVALTAAGFLVPRVLAVGEERTALGVRRSWCATAALGGEPIASRIAALALARDRATLRAKRGMLAMLGREVARLHRSGVVAGDLVPANVWIALAATDVRIAFLDHDRTRIATAPVPWRRARRNLVQLNRVVLPGVTTTDRMRVYRAYTAGRAWSRPAAHQRLPWIVTKTMARRRAERGHATVIPPDADFRAVMRADGPYARPFGEDQP
jgi:tRNA A-37 threonylcarbamoyl transferase component Bud32